jgi:two-component system chemotaxis sensor kinase CheA
VTAVPLAPRLAHLANATRELAQSMGREVSVDVSCEASHAPAETADTLDAALMHLVRNAVAHGVERVDERTAAGKKPRATIRIATIERGGFTEASVTDDGRGIDCERVKRTAVEHGIITPERALELRTREVLRLVFEPGFSTASAVTDISGRGIGLDAVRAAVEERGGTVEVRSTKGEGTTILLRIPQASARATVHLMRVPGVGVPFAVSAEWTEAGSRPLDKPAGIEAAPLLDVLGALGIAATTQQKSGRMVRLSRGEQYVSILVAGDVEMRMAERVCPTPPDFMAEVVLVDHEECLLFRPECLGQSPASQKAGSVA